MRTQPVLPDVFNLEDDFAILTALFGEGSPPEALGPADPAPIVDAVSADAPEQPEDPGKPDGVPSVDAGLGDPAALVGPLSFDTGDIGAALGGAPTPVDVNPDSDPVSGKPAGTPGGGGGGNGGTDTGDGSVLSSYTSGGDPSGFNIAIKFGGALPWTSDLQKAFIDAAEFISDIITGDIPDVRFQGKIDDVRIDASLADIDGAGGILGQAAPTVYRTDSKLPAAGFMQFDVADAENYDNGGLFNDIVFHEMMHVLGFGTMWDEMGLVTQGGDDLLFIGALATVEFAYEFGTVLSGVPVETDGGAGTAGGHWNEGDVTFSNGSTLTDTDAFPFDNEIMTGFINGSNYLSDTTIAALEDMGYDTIYNPDAAVDGQGDDVYQVGALDDFGIFGGIA